jgi:tetratricopeptide (TPR) repeat protein
MNVAFFILLAVLRATANSPAIDDADRLFAYGENYENERRALEILENALATDPNDYQLLWRVSRSYYYVGDGAGKDRTRYFQKGIDAGLRAVARNPGGVEGHYWLGASYGGYCREAGGITAFVNVKKVRVEMETVLGIDPNYEDASAYMALGEIDRQLPKIFGGSLKRSLDSLETGLRLAPKSQEMKYAIAESYLQTSRKVEARAQLEELLRLPLTSSRTNENRRALEKARKLLAKIDQKQ